MITTTNSRTGLTIILSAIAIALGAACYAMWGGVMFAFYASTLPVGLFLLWMSRDVPSWEEKWAPAPPAPAPRPRAARAIGAEPAESRA
jgi:hypothetical protein